MSHIEIIAHANGFENKTQFVPKEIYLAPVEEPSYLDGFQVSLTYWNFDEIDNEINKRMSETLHGLAYDPEDWTGIQKERIESVVVSIYQELGPGTVGVINRQQLEFFQNILEDVEILENLPSRKDIIACMWNLQQEDSLRTKFQRASSKAIVMDYATYLNEERRKQEYETNQKCQRFYNSKNKHLENTIVPFFGK